MSSNFWEPQKLDESESDTTFSEIFDVYKKSKNYTFYDMISSNCKHFAQDIFNAICKDSKREQKWICPFDASSFDAFIFNNVKNILSNKSRMLVDLFIRAHIIYRCHLNRLFVTAYLFLFITAKQNDSVLS